MEEGLLLKEREVKFFEESLCSSENNILYKSLNKEDGYLLR